MQKVENKQIGPHCMLACLYFLLLPTTIAVNSAGNSILKLATVPIGLFFLVTMFLSNRKLQINGVHLALLVYTFSAVSMLFIDASSVSIDDATGYVLNAALYICLSVIPYSPSFTSFTTFLNIIKSLHMKSHLPVTYFTHNFI